MRPEFWRDADELYAQLIATPIFDAPERTKIKGTLFEQWVGTKYPNLDMSTEPVFGEKVEEGMLKSELLKKIRRGDGVSEVQYERSSADLDQRLLRSHSDACSSAQHEARHRRTTCTRR